MKRILIFVALNIEFITEYGKISGRFNLDTTDRTDSELCTEQYYGI